MDDYDDDGEPTVQSIHHYNPMEEAAQRYWRASRIWRDKEESTWNTGQMIQECRGITCYRGKVSGFAYVLLDDVVNNRREHILQLQPEQQIPTAANEEECKG